MRVPLVEFRLTLWISAIALNLVDQFAIAVLL